MRSIWLSIRISGNIIVEFLICHASCASNDVVIYSLVICVNILICIGYGINEILNTHYIYICVHLRLEILYQGACDKPLLCNDVRVPWWDFLAGIIHLIRKWTSWQHCDKWRWSRLLICQKRSFRTIKSVKSMNINHLFKSSGPFLGRWCKFRLWIAAYPKLKHNFVSLYKVTTEYILT